MVLKHKHKYLWRNWKSTISIFSSFCLSLVDVIPQTSFSNTTPNGFQYEKWQKHPLWFFFFTILGNTLFYSQSPGLRCPPCSLAAPPPSTQPLCVYKYLPTLPSSPRSRPRLFQIWAVFSIFCWPSSCLSPSF